MTDLDSALRRVERLSADLGRLLDRTRTAPEGAARDRALTASIAVNEQLGQALTDVGELLEATRVAIVARERTALVLH